MDFPANLATNAYKLTDVDEIHWVFYTATELDQPAPPVPFYLLEVEYQLRCKSVHVLFDSDCNGLWVFSLPQDDVKGVPEPTELFNVTSSVRGSLRAHDLAAANSQQSTDGGPQAAAPCVTITNNSHPFNLDAASSPASTWNADGNASPVPESGNIVYARLIEAINRSLAFNLATQPGWSLLNSKTCVDDDSVGAGSQNGSLESKTGSFEVRWSLSGTLTATTILTLVPKLYRLSDFVRSKQTETLVHIPLLLLPAGIRATFCGTEFLTKREARSSATQEIKATARLWLSRLGHHLPKDTQWVRVRVAENGLGREIFYDALGLATAYPEFLWPAVYCLCKTPTLQNYSRGDSGITENDIQDPIEKAESWFNGRFERAKATEAKKQQIELEARRATLLDQTHQQDAKDAMSPLELRLNTQDASGVYPTPPDGVPSHAHDTPRSGHEPDFENVDDAPKTLGDAPYKYNDNEHNDLFVDHDMDIGLTEDDFAFFDEPGVEGLNTGDENISPQSYGIEAEATAAAEDPLSSSVQDRNLNSGLEAMEQTESSSPVRRSAEILSAFDHSPNANSQGGFLYPDIAESIPPENVSNSMPEDGREGAVERRSRDSGKSEIDDKYVMKGRFAFDVLGAETLVDDTKHSAMAASGLPRVGLLEGSASDTEEEADLDSDRLTSVSSAEEASDNPIDGVNMQQSDDRADNRTENGTPGDDLCCLSPYILIDPSRTTYEGFAHNEIANLTHFFSRESEAQPMVGKDATFIQTAQIVVDQAVTHSQAHGSSSSVVSPLDAEDRYVYGFSADRFAEAVRNCFPTSIQYSLSEYTMSIATTQSQPDTGRHFKDLGQKLLQLDPPHTCIRRIGSRMDILSSAICFWEELSLEPSHGRKDVLALCLDPQEGKRFRRAIDVFLKMMRDAYQACNLGIHDVVAGIDDIYAEAQQDDYESFGQKLAKLDSGDGTILIYIINDDDNTATPPELCAASLSILTGYRSAFRDTQVQQSSDLVLQIIPRAIVLFPNRLHFPSMANYKKLAFEVYDRCGPRPKEHDGVRFSYMSAPAVYLSKSIPPKIDFRLTSNSSMAALDDDDCVHLAYVWMRGNEWLTASWTDNVGILQWNAAYCIGENYSDPWHPFVDVAKELLETTLEMLQPSGRCWRIFIAKTGGLLTDELNAWQSVLAESNGSYGIVTFLTVNQNTSLTFAQPMNMEAESSELSPLLATDADISATAALSPEVPASTPTPSGGTGFSDQDPEARLIDVRDETWALLLEISIDDMLMPSAFCRAQSSGFLLKRAGTRDEDGLVPLSVNILHEHGNNPTPLLELLEMYRKLATLARIRNITDPVIGAMPWHVAAAVRAHAAIKWTMRYGGE